MSQLVKDQQDGYWKLPTSPYKINGTDKVTFTFPTENKFVDADMVIEVKADAASSLALSINDLASSLSMGTPSSGVYSPTVSLTGTVSAGTAGWFNSATLTDSSVAIGTINQSTMSNGGSSVASGDTITPGPSTQTITISEGYNTARTLIIGSASSSTPGVVTSGSATIDTLTYAYVSADSEYTITGSADVSAPTVGTAGYISGSVGTLNSNTGGATVSATVAAITLASSLSGATTARKPTLSKQTISITGVTDAASGNATATAPNSGVYVAVRSAANTATINSAPSITTAGYGSGSNFIAGTYESATVGAAQSDIYYIPITTTSATVSGRNVTYGTGWITSGTSSVAVGNVTSGAGVATISSPTWDSTSSNFTVSASGSIAAPTVNTAGYISTTEGTRTGNSISGSTSLDLVQVGVTVSGTAKVTPSITRTAKPSGDTWVDAASGSATTTKPSSGAYVRVDAAAASNNLTITGKVSSEGYGTTDHYSTDTATVTAVGSNAAASTYVPITAGTVTSGSATISSVSVSQDDTDYTWHVTGSANVSAPTASTAGYISSSIGTRSGNTNGATVNATLTNIALETSFYHSSGGTITTVTDSSVTPVISKTNATNISEAGTATTSQPSSGYYVAVQSAQNKSTVTADCAITTAGYGTPESSYGTTLATIDTGANASAVTYIPISGATFANSATNGVTYTDISSTGPILISGDYLYINAGYTPNQKISLARLVPDASGTNASASYILSGYTAFNNDGALIVGTMQTYDGSYTIT